MVRTTRHAEQPNFRSPAAAPVPGKRLPPRRRWCSASRCGNRTRVAPITAQLTRFRCSGTVRVLRR
ncbi:CGNR zinc finger domain-containing protein [Saccharopolyspora sp. NPDC050642]|uniref:CGNR zinc finger domain-containing protein n=1 Tax=Saccharopolyspora sp. NPDC050642 TaxID=3157099 RepID=UPI0034114604